jgi:hypothetical protein
VSIVASNPRRWIMHLNNVVAWGKGLSVR